METPRDLLSKLKRTIEPPKPPPPPSEGFEPNGSEGRPSEKEMRLEGAKALVQLYEEQDRKKREGHRGGQVLDIHNGTGGFGR
jgi:hypothetical protein